MRLLTTCCRIAVVIVAVVAWWLQAPRSRAQAISIAPATMTEIGTVDDRFQSYNVEMLSVTGGAFWKPYDAPARGGQKPELYQERPPLDLDSPRLRKLAAALGPAYIRVSGTWANTTFFAGSPGPPAAPPPGFTGVLTRARWNNLIAFAKAVDAKIVTSFAVGVGTRDAAGVWTSEQARQLLDATRDAGGWIAAAEFMNEPTLAVMNGPPAGYDAAAYGRDFKIFHAFVRQIAPDMLVLGPGSVGEEVDPPLLKAGDLLAASEPDVVDALSYHHYGALSQRCAASGAQTRADDALSEHWLARTDTALAFSQNLRDRFAPGKPIWLTETADAACGGNPWASTFLDTFRYLDQLGRLARQGVQVVMHNTLVWSDYGLLDEATFRPRPNYWAAVLWRRLMGPTVLDPGVAIGEGLHLYAHCLRGETGGVALLAINTSRTRSAAVRFPLPLEIRRYTLSASTPLQGAQAELNGRELALGVRDELPDLEGEPATVDTIELAPATIAFVAVARAGNRSCS